MSNPPWAQALTNGQEDVPFKAVMVAEIDAFSTWPQYACAFGWATETTNLSMHEVFITSGLVDPDSPSEPDVGTTRSDNVVGTLVTASLYDEISTGSINIWRLEYTGTEVHMYLNGVNFISSGTLDKGTMTNATRFNIGRDPNGSGRWYWNGKIGEILVANGSSTTQQIEQYENHLIKYYGLSS